MPAQRVSWCSTSWVVTDCTYGILGLNERVIDGDDMNVIMLDGIAIDNAPNSPEAVDSDVGRHSG